MKNTIPCLLLLAALSPVWANSSFQCDNYLQGGMIWTQQNPVILTYCDQFGLLPLTEVAAPSGGSGGGPVYQWAFSLDGAFWQPITVSAGQQRDLIPGSALLNFMLAAGMDYSQSTWFRRGVKRPECDDYVFSNIVEFRVFHQVSGPGQFRSVWEYCNDQNGLNASYFHTGNPNSVNPSGGDQPYEFQWQFSTDQVNWSNYSTTELPDLFITPGTIGYYRRGVKPAGSPCEYAFSNTIAISNVIPFELNLALDHPDCSDENTGRITVIDLSGNSPEILNSIAYSIDGGNSWQYSPVFDHLTAGFYTVQTQNKCSCPNGYSWCTAEAELTAAPAPEILDVDFIHPSDCGAADGSITIYGSGGIAPLKFSINGATYWQQTVFTGLPAGNYPISVQNADGSCERFFGSVTLNDPPQPVLEEVIQVNPTGCGASDGSIQVIASGGIQPLEFRLNSGSWITGGVFTGLPAGVYQIGIRNAGGSCQTITSTTLTSPAGPSIVSVDHSEPSDCSTADGTITINAAGGTGNLQYNIGFGWMNTPVFNNLSPGNYTISVRNQNGTCQVDYPAPIVLNGPSSPQISSINSTDPSDCDAGDGSISVIASGNSGNLEYNIGLGWSSNSIFQGLPPGNYTVQVRNANGTCLVTHPEVIVISGPLSPVIHQVSTTNVSGCGATDGTIEIIASGAGPLEYNIGIGWSVNSVFMGLEPGLYPIQVRNHDGTCLVNYPGAEEVAGPDLPVIIAVVASAPSDCEVADGAISIQMEDPAGEYEFTINGGNTWSEQPQFGGLSPGLYAVGVRDSDQSCFVDYGQVEITGIVSPAILDVSFNNPSDCGTADGSIQIGATGINSLEYRVNITDTWTANPLFEGLGPGDYQVQVRNSDGTCIINYPSQITLSSPPSPIIPSVNFTDPTDCGADDGSIQVHSISGTGTYEVSIDNGQTWFDHANFFNLPPGDYEVMVRNNGGTCVVEYDQIITLSNPPMPVISNIAVAHPTDCGANDGTITISAGAGTGNFQFNIGGSWSSNSVFSGLSHGNYTVQVRNSNGTCPVEYDQIVSLTDPPLPFISNVSTTNPTDCGADDGSITISAGAGTGNFQFNIGSGWTSNAAFSGLPPGNYTIQVRNSNGTCPVAYNQTVTLSDPPLPVISNVVATNPTDCGADDGTITISVGAGTGNFQFNIGSGWTNNAAFSGLQPGEYTIQVRNSNGTCAVEYNQIVSLTDPPLPVISNVVATDPTDCGADDGSITISAGAGTGNFQFNIGSGWTNNAAFSGLPPGDYTIQVRNSNGTCAVEYNQIVSLTDPPLPFISNVSTTNPTDCGADDGTITISAGAGTGNFQFNIGSGWTSNAAFSGLPPGDYTIQVRNSNGTCPVEYDQIVSLTDPPLPFISNVSTTNPTDCGADDGSITISAGAGTGNFQFNIGSGWTNNAAFSGLQPGDYTIQVRNSNGTCPVAYNQTVTLSDPPLPVISNVVATNPTDCGADDGTITISVGAGTGNFQFNIGSGWTNNAAFSGLPPGDYTIQVRNSNGTCPVEYDQIVSLTDPPLPFISNVSTTNPTDCGADDGSITISAGAGTGNFQFNIGSGWTNNAAFSGLQPGDYTIQVRNSNGTCPVEYDQIVSLTDPPLPVISNVVATDPTDCGADDGSITISVGAGTGNFQFNIGSSWSSNSAFFGLPSGDYNIQVRNSNGTCPVEYDQIVSLTDPPLPVISNVVATDPTDCGADDGTITISVGAGTGNFQFNIGSGWTSNAAFWGLQPGDYTVQVRNSNGTCAVEYNQIVSLTEPPLPVISNVFATDPTDCGADDGTITISAGAGTGNFQFNIGSGWTNNAAFSGLPPGDYTIQVRNSNGTCPVAYNQTITLSDPPLPVISNVAATNPTDCGADDGSITISAGAGTGNFQFNIGSGWTNNAAFSGLPPGDYTIQVRNSNGTCPVAYNQTITLSDPPLPVISNVAATDPTDCGADDGTITISVGAGTGNFQFNIGSGWTSNAAFSGLQPGDYTIQVRNSNGTCPVEYNQTITLTDPPLPVISNVVATDPTDCGADDGSITISAGAGTGNFQFNIGSGWTNNAAFSGLPPGDYTIQVRNSNGTCAVEYNQIVSLTDPPLPFISNVSTTNPTDCGADDGSITISAGAGTGNFQFNIGSGWTNNAAFSGLQPGEYTIQVRNSNGTCPVAYNQTVTLTDPPLPVISNVAATNPTDCGADDGTITISVGAGTGNFQFNIGSGWTNNAAFSGLPPGNYTIQVRNSNGTCPVAYNQTITLTDPPLPVISNVAATNPTDCGADDGTITISAGAGTGNFQFNIGSGWTNNAAFSGLQPGDYTIQVRNSNGTCPVEYDQIVSLAEPPLPVISNVAATDPTDCGADDGSITISAGAGTGNLQFNIGSGWTSSAVFSGLQPGDYTIQVRNSNGTCPVAYNQIITLSDPPLPVISNVAATNPTDCGADDGTITISAGAGTGNFQFNIGSGWTSNAAFSGLPPGDYTIQVRNSNGTCPVGYNQIVSLTDPPLPFISNVSTTNPTDCGADDGTITISAGAGTGNFQFNIGSGWTSNAAFSGLQPGEYTIQVRNSNGTCPVEYNQTITLSEPPLPAISNVAATDPTDCGETDGVIQIVATGGDGNFLFTINGGANWSMNPDFYNLGPGNYQVGVQNGNGTCENFINNSIQLIAPESPSILEVSVSQPSDCNEVDGIIEIFATEGSESLQYRINDNAPWSNSPIFTGLAPGIYHVAVQNAGGNCLVVYSQPVQIQAIQAPEFVQIESFSPTDCNLNNGNIIITAQGNFGEVIYSISNGNTWQSSPVFDNLSPGFFQIAIAYGNSSCLTTYGQPVEVTGLQPPAILEVNSNDISDCNAADGTITILAQGGSGDYQFNIDPDNYPWSGSNQFTGLQPGIYHPAVRNADGSCYVEYLEPIVLQSPEAPVIVAVQSSDLSDCNAADGTITILVQGGSGDYQFNIDPDNYPWSGSNQFTGLQPGIYHPAVRNADGSCAVDYLEPVVLQSPEAPVIVAVQSSDLSDCNAADGTITILAQGGSGDYQFNIDPDNYPWSGSNQFTGLESGIYHPAVRNADGSCAVDYLEPVVLQSPEAPVIVAVQSSDLSDCNAADGTITILAQGGSGDYQFNIDPDNYPWSGSNQFTGLQPGIYHPAVRNADGSCAVDYLEPVVLQSPEAPVIVAVQSSDLSDCNAADGTITILAQGGSGDYQFNIDPDNYPWSGSNQFTGLQPGIYHPAVRNADGSCPVDYLEPVVLQSPEAPVIVAVQSSDLSDCNAADGTITILAQGGSGDYQFNIDPDNYPWSGSNQFTGLQPGIYHPAVRNADGSCAVDYLEPVVLQSPEAPVIVAVQSSDLSDCNAADGTITILAQGGSGDYQFNIDPDNYPWSGSNQFTGLQPGIYHPAVRNADGSCAVDYLEPVVLQSPEAPVIVAVQSSDLSDCNAADGTITILAQGGSGDYQFNIDPDNYPWSGSNQFTGLQSGIYHPAVRNADGSCAVDYLEPVVLQSPEAPVIVAVQSSDLSDCNAADGTITILAQGGSGDYQFNIDPDNYPWSGSNQFTGLQSGIYHPAVRNADGSCAVDYLEPVVLQSPEAPVIVAVQSSDLSDCNAADGTITIYSSSGSNYEFSLNGLEWSNSGIFTGLITGQYLPQIRNLDGSCRSVYPDTISLANPFEAEIDSLILTPPSSCLTSDGECLISGFNAATMAYSLDGGQTWKQDSVITGLGTGPISLEIRGVDYPGCKIEMDRFLGAGDFNLSELFFRIGDQQACLENDGSIEIQSHSVNDFQFSIDYGETWQASGLFTALAPGSYQVLLRDSSLNCQVMLDTSFVVHALPTPEVQGITTLDAEDCGGNNGVVILETDNQDCVYSLDGGETWQAPTVFDALLPGTYILMARDTVSNCGIAYPDSITIRGIPLLTAQILEQSQPTCADENNGYAIAGAYGGIPPYVYTWSNSAGEAELNDLGPGTYSVTVVDSRQCRDSTAVAFDEMDDPFTGLPSLVRDTILCNGQSVRFDLSFLVNAEIEWHNRDGFHSTDPAIELERPGIYYLKILTSAGCRYLDTFEIRRINQDLIADFLLPAEAVIDEPVVAVDITWPLPDSIHWAYDQNTIQHLLSLPTQEFLRFTEPGTYSVFMDAYYGSCFDRLGKEIKVFGSRDSLSSNSQPGSSGLIAAFEIYPNPNDGRFTFKLVLTLPGNADIWLFRESGQLLEHRSVNGSQTYIEAFDRRGLLPGIYTMVAQAGSDWVFGNFVVN